MTRRWLKPFSGGIVVASLLWGSAYHQQWSDHSKNIVVRLTYNDGPYAEPTNGKNPFDTQRPVNDYAIGLVKQCGVRRFKTWSNMDTTDVPESAWLEVDPDEISNAQFNCLNSFVRPTYVRLTFESRK